MHKSWVMATALALLLSGCASETESKDGGDASASAVGSSDISVSVTSESVSASEALASAPSTVTAAPTVAPIDVSKCVEARKTEWETISVYCSVGKEWREGHLVSLTARVSEAIGRTIQSKKIDTGTAKFIHVTILPPVQSAASQNATSDALRVSYFVYELKSANYDALGAAGTLDMAIDVQSKPKALAELNAWCKSGGQKTPNFCAKAQVPAHAAVEDEIAAKAP